MWGVVCLRLPLRRRLLLLLLLLLRADIAEQPLAMGYKVDSAGRRGKASFLTGKIQGQYIYEGLVAGILLGVGAMGFITLKAANDTTVASTPKRRASLVMVGLAIVWLSYLGTRGFITLKIPTYLST